MNLLPFDIEKVKAGAKFCHEDGTKPEGYEVTKYGIVIKWPENFPIFYLPEDFHNLRLLPEEREVWINVWKDDNGSIYASQLNSEKEMINDRNSLYRRTHLETIHKTYTI